MYTYLQKISTLLILLKILECVNIAIQLIEVSLVGNLGWRQSYFLTFKRSSWSGARSEYLWHVMHRVKQSCIAIWYIYIYIYVCVWERERVFIFRPWMNKLSEMDWHIVKRSPNIPFAKSAVCYLLGPSFFFFFCCYLLGPFNFKPVSSGMKVKSSQVIRWSGFKIKWYSME